MSSEKFLNSTRVYELWAKIKAALSGKQDVLTPGDGIDIKENAVSLTNPVRGVLTQAEFAALTAEQRASGTYFVDDGQGGNSGWDTYSTEERRVGTWIDGKPIYRKVFGGTISALQEYVPFGKVSDLDVVCSANGILYCEMETGTAEYFLACPSADVYISVLKDKESVAVYTTYPEFVGRKMTVVLEYTKNTDQGAIK